MTGTVALAFVRWLPGVGFCSVGRSNCTPLYLQMIVILPMIKSITEADQGPVDRLPLIRSQMDL